MSDNNKCVICQFFYNIHEFEYDYDCKCLKSPCSTECLKYNQQEEIKGEQIWNTELNLNYQQCESCQEYICQEHFDEYTDGPFTIHGEWLMVNLKCDQCDKILCLDCI